MQGIRCSHLQRKVCVFLLLSHLQAGEVGVDQLYSLCFSLKYCTTLQSYTSPDSIVRGNLQRRREAVVCSAGLIVQTIYGTIHEQTRRNEQRHTSTLLCHIILLEVQWVESSLVVYSYSSLQRADQQTKNDTSNLTLHCFEKCQKLAQSRHG